MVFACKDLLMHVVLHWTYLELALSQIGYYVDALAGKDRGLITGEAEG
jgi:hypothetical protein